MSTGVCRQCEKLGGIDRRDLCRDCYRDPGTRRLYPQLPTLAPALPDGSKPPAGPTRELGGTAGKVSVLAARAASGEFLWHPNDAVI